MPAWLRLSAALLIILGLVGVECGGLAEYPFDMQVSPSPWDSYDKPQINQIIDTANEVHRVYNNHIKQVVLAYLNGSSVVLFTSKHIWYSEWIKKLLRSSHINFNEVHLDSIRHGEHMHRVLTEITGREHGPFLFFNGEDLEGIQNIYHKYVTGELHALLVSR